MQPRLCIIFNLNQYLICPQIDMYTHPYTLVRISLVCPNNLTVHIYVDIFNFNTRERYIFQWTAMPRDIFLIKTIDSTYENIIDIHDALRNIDTKNYPNYWSIFTSALPTDIISGKILLQFNDVIDQLGKTYFTWPI